jgi:membrane-associated phospholipid phosphatase
MTATLLMILLAVPAGLAQPGEGIAAPPAVAVSAAAEQPAAEQPAAEQPAAEQPAPPAAPAAPAAAPAVAPAEPAPPASETAATAAAKDSSSPAGHDGVSAGMSWPKLLLVDLREVFRSPEHWHGREWALFSAEVAAIVGVVVVDESLQRDVTRRQSRLLDDLAKDFRPFGSYGAVGVLGGFYLAGMIAHDKDAEATTVDGLFASGIAAGLISPFLKVAVGRSRPNAHQGDHDFAPFSFHNSSTSFPAGEATEAFTVASVITAHYPSWWVGAISYTTATMTALGRVRQGGHWVSDTLVGALIGHHVGRAVVHINERLRGHLTFSPLISPGARGASVTASF